jgi:hypothetical protein
MKTIELSAVEYLHFCLIISQDKEAPSYHTKFLKESVIITCDITYLESLGY